MRKDRSSRHCSSQTISITSDARYADDRAIVPASPSSGLGVNVPAIDPCVSRIDITPASLSVALGATANVSAALYDAADNLLTSLPAGAVLTWEAVQGSITAGTGNAATYTAPSELETEAIRLMPS